MEGGGVSFVVVVVVFVKGEREGGVRMSDLEWVVCLGGGGG